MGFYRKLPVTIEARQWDGGAASATPVINWMLDNGSTARYHEETQGVFHWPEAIVIDTLEGRMNASPGDFIIKGVQGEFYAIKPDIFEQTYEEANSETTPVDFAGEFT